MKDIVITVGTAIGSVLSLSRLIKENIHCKVYILSSNSRTKTILESSSYIDHVSLISGTDETSFFSSIQEWYKLFNFNKKPILYCTTDNHTYYIDNNRFWFEDRFDLCMPSSTIIRSFTKKGEAEIVAESHGLLTPKTLLINSDEGIEQVISTFNFPVILKPQATYLKKGLDFKVQVIENKKYFRKALKDLLKINSILCQEYVPGKTDNCFYYLFYRDKKGLIYETMGKKTLQSGPNGGIMLKGKSEYNKELSRICKKFLNDIDYCGIGGIEFKEYRGRYFFIEMNPRVEGILKVSEDSGVPLGLISYNDISDLEVTNTSQAYEQIDGIIYTDLVSTLKYYLKNKKILTAFQNFTKAITDPKVKINIFSPKDTKPFILDVAFSLLRK